MGGTGSRWPPASGASGQTRSCANERRSLGPAHRGCSRGQGGTSAGFWLWCSTCRAVLGCRGRTRAPRGWKSRSIALATTPRCCLSRTGGDKWPHLCSQGIKPTAPHPGPPRDPQLGSPRPAPRGMRLQHPEAPRVPARCRSADGQDLGLSILQRLRAPPLSPSSPACSYINPDQCSQCLAAA